MPDNLKPDKPVAKNETSKGDMNKLGYNPPPPYDIDRPKPTPPPPPKKEGK